MKQRYVLLHFGIAVSLCASCAETQTPDFEESVEPLAVERQATWLGNEAGYYAQFGIAVALDGDLAVVGAAEGYGTWFPGFTPGAGSAYVFRRTAQGWIQEAKLTESSLPSGVGYAFDVAVSGDTIAVASASTRQVFVYRAVGTSWQQEAVLTPEPGGYFFDVALEGNILIAGGAGPVSVFVRDASGWHVQALLTGDSSQYTGFGYSVALSGNTVAVGAYADDANGTGGGAIYVFERQGTTWARQAKLLASGDTSTRWIGARFGFRVALDGDWLVGGAPDAGPLIDPGGTGAVYVFQRSGTKWTQQARIVLEDARERRANRFSYGGVALRGSILVVGSPQEPSYGEMGNVYVYERQGDRWLQVSRLGTAERNWGDRYGANLALSDSDLLVGAPGRDVHAAETGWAYHYSVGRGVSSDADNDGVSIRIDCDDQDSRIGAVLFEDDFSRNSGWFVPTPQLSRDPWIYQGGAVRASDGGQQVLLGSPQSWRNVVVEARISADGTWGGCCGNEGPTNRWRAGIMARANLDSDQDEGFSGYRCAVGSNATAEGGIPYVGESTGLFLQLAEFRDAPEDDIPTEYTGGWDPTFDELAKTPLFSAAMANLPGGDTVDLRFWAVGDTLRCELVAPDNRTVQAGEWAYSFDAGTIGLSTLNMYGRFEHVRVCEGLSRF